MLAETKFRKKIVHNNTPLFHINKKQNQVTLVFDTANFVNGQPQPKKTKTNTKQENYEVGIHYSIMIGWKSTPD